MDDYEKYEEDCEKIRTFNTVLLNEFTAWLKASGLAPKTIKSHCSNIDFYINEFLLYEDATEAEEGVDEVNMFLGYWFIKKAMWASPASIKSNATSLKKFYTFMEEKKLIAIEDLNNLKRVIKEHMPEWLESLERYDDPSIDIW